MIKPFFDFDKKKLSLYLSSLLYDSTKKISFFHKQMKTMNVEFHLKVQQQKLKLEFDDFFP